MKPGVVAKLCQQCEELYADAALHLGRERLRPLWDRDWLTRVEARRMAFGGLAQYYQSRVSALSTIRAEWVLVNVRSKYNSLAHTTRHPITARTCTPAHL